MLLATGGLSSFGMGQPMDPSVQLLLLQQQVCCLEDWNYGHEPLRRPTTAHLLVCWYLIIWWLGPQFLQAAAGAFGMTGLMGAQATTGSWADMQNAAAAAASFYQRQAAGLTGSPASVSAFEPSSSSKIRGLPYRTSVRISHVQIWFKIMICMSFWLIQSFRIFMRVVLIFVFVFVFYGRCRRSLPGADRWWTTQDAPDSEAKWLILIFFFFFFLLFFKILIVRWGNRHFRFFLMKHLNHTHHFLASDAGWRYSHCLMNVSTFLGDYILISPISYLFFFFGCRTFSVGSGWGKTLFEQCDGPQMFIQALKLRYNHVDWLSTWMLPWSVCHQCSFSSCCVCNVRSAPSFEPPDDNHLRVLSFLLVRPDNSLNLLWLLNFKQPLLLQNRPLHKTLVTRYGRNGAY